MRVWAQITLEMRRGPVMGVKSEKGRKKEEEGGEEQKRGGFGGWRLRCVGVGACVFVRWVLLLLCLFIFQMGPSPS
jgi:hypothetical protein